MTVFDFYVHIDSFTLGPNFYFTVDAVCLIINTHHEHFCITRRKIAGSVSDFVIGIFRSLKPAGRTVALVVESACNRNEYQEHFLEYKGSRCDGLTTIPPSYADFLKIWEPFSPGPLRACTGMVIYTNVGLHVKR